MHWSIGWWPEWASSQYNLPWPVSGQSESDLFDSGGQIYMHAALTQNGTASPPERNEYFIYVIYPIYISAFSPLLPVCVFHRGWGFTHPLHTHTLQSRDGVTRVDDKASCCIALLYLVGNVMLDKMGYCNSISVVLICLSESRSCNLVPFWRKCKSYLIVKCQCSCSFLSPHKWYAEQICFCTFCFCNLFLGVNCHCRQHPDGLAVAFLSEAVVELPGICQELQFCGTPPLMPSPSRMPPSCGLQGD